MSSGILFVLAALAQPVVATDYGADPEANGVSDWSALETATTVARAEGRPLYLPPGVYEVHMQWDISGVRVEGERHQGTMTGSIVRSIGTWSSQTAGAGPCDPDAPTAGSVVLAAGDGFALRNVIVDVDAPAPYGLYTCRTHRTVTEVDGLTVNGGTRSGVYFDASQGMVARRILSRNAAEVGITIRDGNSSTFERVQVDYSGLAGFFVTSSGPFASGAVYVRNLGTEGCGHLAPASSPWLGAQIRVVNVTAPTVFDGVWSEVTSADAISLESSNHISVRNAYLKGYGNAPSGATNRAIRLVAANQNTFENVAVAREQTGTDMNWATQIKLVGNSAYNTFRSVFYRSSSTVPDPQRMYIPVTYGDSVNTLERPAGERYSPPYHGYGRLGDTVKNSDPVPGSPSGWVCAQEDDIDPDPDVTYYACTVWRSTGMVGQ